MDFLEHTKGDLEYWTDVLNDITEAYKRLYSVFGMTEIVKHLIIAAYKIKIGAMEQSLRQAESWKNSSMESSTDPEVIYKYADIQNDLEATQKAYDHFLATGEMLDEDSLT